MRLLFLVLAVLTLITQYPLWLGKGGWLRVQELHAKVASQQETNEALVARNNALQAEVQDLQSGTAAIEERARTEQGMIREGEVFVQILAPHEHGPAVITPDIPERKGN
ncbi:cell division protein FtsB [Pollutimonas thiosulfatoxidans]|uniref:Cell division protein FtsB n=1 Tax=Pollutimonas thiosulfatoxidans TaxID=2028345 RepID=A0A410GGM6_9BURK|nr:cell division protein FtsB [Pollutimonas thiosulfatoxidans]MBF6617427.1 cell division protein FtsB [Candidimonas sp.]QAA95428.1 cell division protein FtsB [Pollutimonas thiosulfatoxidans]